MAIDPGTPKLATQMTALSGNIMNAYWDAKIIVQNYYDRGIINEVTDLGTGIEDWEERNETPVPQTDFDRGTFLNNINTYIQFIKWVEGDNPANGVYRTAMIQAQSLSGEIQP